MIELLNKKHNRKDFDCGKELLNDYLKTQAGQDVKRKLSVCFVLTDSETKVIQGYYILSNRSIPLSSFSEQIKKNFQNPINQFQLPCLVDWQQIKNIREMELEKFY